MEARKGFTPTPGQAPLVPPPAPRVSLGLVAAIAIAAAVWFATRRKRRRRRG